MGNFKLKHLFTINIFLAIFFGITCAFFPGIMFRLYRMTPNPDVVWVTRLVGGSILGFATLMFFGRKSASSETRRAIAYALLVQDVISFLASMEFVISRHAASIVDWSSPILYLLLALGYAYFLWINPSDS